MPGLRRASSIAVSGLVLALQAVPGFASGREGEQYVPVVQFIVVATLAALLVTIGGGIVSGAVRAQRTNASILKGGALGVLKGLGAFVVLAVVTTGVLTVASGLFIAYAFIVTRGVE